MNSIPRAALALSLLSALAPAEVRLPALLGDHMVLQREGRVALFTHSMVIRVVLQAMLESSRATAHLTHVDHTSLTTFGRSRRGWHMLRVNDAAHLSEHHGAPKLGSV